MTHLDPKNCNEEKHLVYGQEMELHADLLKDSQTLFTNQRPQI